MSEDIQDITASPTPVRRLYANSIGYVIATYCWTREEALDEMQNFINEETKKLRAENVKRRPRCRQEAHA